MLRQFFHAPSNRRSSLLARRLQFESLEPRTLLAGDVRVLVRGGDLIVSGSSDDNAINIDAGPTADSAIITPRGDTTVNGGTAPVQVDGITDDWRINLRDGNNQLTVPFITINVNNRSVSIPGDLRISLRHGDNSLNLSGIDADGDVFVRAGHGLNSILFNPDITRVSRFGGDVRIYTGNGNGKIELFQVQVGGDVIVRAAGGDDEVRVGGAVTIGDDLDIRAGDGQDFVSLGLFEPLIIPASGSAAAGASAEVRVTTSLTPLIDAVPIRIADRVFVDLGDGDDEFRAAVETSKMTAINRSGDGSFLITNSQIAHRLGIKSSDGQDTVIVRKSEVDGIVAIRTGSGDDQIRFDHTRLADRAFFNLGADDDELFFDLSSAGLLRARFGAGDDLASLMLCHVDATALDYAFDGGEGNDHAGATFSIKPLTRNFELFSIVGSIDEYCDQQV